VSTAWAPIAADRSRTRPPGLGRQRGAANRPQRRSRERRHGWAATVGAAGWVAPLPRARHRSGLKGDEVAGRLGGGQGLWVERQWAGPREEGWFERAARGAGGAAAAARRPGHPRRPPTGRGGARAATAPAAWRLGSPHAAAWAHARTTGHGRGDGGVRGGGGLLQGGMTRPRRGVRRTVVGGRRGRRGAARPQVVNRRRDGTGGRGTSPLMRSRRRPLRFRQAGRRRLAVPHRPRGPPGGAPAIK
jgi:hypothetical protein